MGIKEYEYKHRIRYKGVLDYAGLYKVMSDWFQLKGYEFHEKMYRPKFHFHAPTAFGSELEVRWEARRKPNDLVEYWITVFMHLWDVDQVEIIKDGQKKPGYRCRMLIELDGWFNTDPAERWSKSKFLFHLEHWMNKYLFWRKVTLYDDDIRYSLHVLNDRIRRFLDFESKGNEYANLSR